MERLECQRAAGADIKIEYSRTRFVRLFQMPWLWALAGPALLLALLSLRGERRSRRYVLSQLRREPLDCPPATVIVPVKGQDEGLRENLAALASLDYPDFELMVAAQRREDIPPGVSPPHARVVIAGPGDPNTGEKIRNLLAAIAAARPSSQVLAFADSDGQVRCCWLRALVAALETPGAGAASGYRHYLPDRASFWPLIRSVWNSAIAGLFGAGSAPFAWGGAMAMRRDDFERLHIAERWHGQVSDDLALTRAVKDAGLRIVFAPGAMVASTDSTTGREFLGWVRRQLTLSRIYDPRLWWTAFLATLVYCASIVACVSAASTGAAWALLVLATQLSLGMLKGCSRGRLSREMFPEREAWFQRYQWIFTWLVPAATWFWLLGFLASASTNVIHWRGNRYALSPRGAKKL